MKAFNKLSSTEMYAASDLIAYIHGKWIHVLKYAYQIMPQKLQTLVYGTNAIASKMLIYQLS